MPSSKGNGIIVGFSGPRMANDGMGNGQTITTGKGNVQTDIIGKRKAQMNTSSQGQGPSSTIGLDKDVFILARNHAKGWGQK